MASFNVPSDVHRLLPHVVGLSAIVLYSWLRRTKDAAVTARQQVVGPPVLGAETSYWLRSKGQHPLDTHRSTEDLPSMVQVVVVGAGMSGCAAAVRCRELGLSVCLIDARGVCGGATGRNGGHLWPSADKTLGRMEFEAQGAEMLKELLRGEEQRGVAEEDGFAPMEQMGGLQLAQDEKQLAVIRRQSEGGQELSKEEVQIAMGLAPGEGPFVGGVLDTQACSICPSRAVRALARKAIEAGANVQTRTRALRVADADGQGAWVETDRGVVKASRGVILCANAWISKLVPELEDMIKPARDHVIVTEPVPRMWEHSFWSPERPGSEEGDDFCFWYGIQMPDGRICLGGGRKEEHGGYAWGEDSEVCADQRVLHDLKHFLAESFPPLRAAKIEYEWSGVLGFSRDDLPILGKVPRRKNVWACCGFGGHGMPVCIPFGREAAELVFHRRDVSVKSYMKDLSPSRFAARDRAGPCRWPLTAS